MSESKQYVVIGGSRGIGHSIVESLISLGHSVTVVSRQAPSTPISGVVYHAYDVMSNEVFPEELLPNVIDGLAYCPGSIVLKPFRSLSEAQFTQDFQINVLGAVRVIKSALKGLKQSEKPGVVLFSTVAVGQGMPFHASIATSKAAIEGLTRSLAAELAPGIRVNCIAPSLTQTDLAGSLLSSPERVDAAKNRHPLKEIGSPADVGNLAAFLMSDQSKWISGQVIGVDGGMSALRV